MTRQGMRHVVVMLAASLLAGCVDSPSEPLAAVDQTPLASSFEALADEMAAHDVERSEELRWAALAVRAGVRPSALEVTNNGVPEIFDAFVHAVAWVSSAQALRPLLHRNLVAWRRGGDLLQVMLVGLATDSAPVLHPFSMRPTSPGGSTASPLHGAKAAYFERGMGNGSSWVGVGGVARIVERPQTSSCDPSDDAAPAGVACQVTRFGVQLNVLFAETQHRDSRDVTQNALTRRVIAPDQNVAGVKLLFSCVTPTADGC
ncbi:MAG TPA: hypothetical protein VF981_05040 [Gemmatimonadaceae bacterium]